MRAILGIVTAFLVCASVHSTARAGEWVTRADGACVELWTAGDLLRGPTAILNGALLPFRSLAGGFALAANECSVAGGCSITSPFYPILGPILGGTFGVYWILTGFADTVTGGLGLLSSPDAATLSLSPVVPLVSDIVPVNRCALAPS
jgi:hypothetical protein